MIPTLVFATSNPNKLKEVKAMLQGQFELKSLKDIGCTEEIPETAPTIEGNAIQKATYVREHYQLDCFAEDTGLEIDALDGEPGVYTARYAGPARDADANMDLVLEKLASLENRSAQFKTVIALIQNGQTHTFEGIVRGTIAHQKSGETGFGYDPIFIPEGYQRTFSEMTAEEKNQISHRARAIQQLQSFLLKT